MFFKMLSRLILSRPFSQFVPNHRPPNKGELSVFKDFLLENNNILVLTGAGVSTESGIPDYRSEGVGVFSRTSYKPIQHADFVKKANVRSRYWARNYVGWNNFYSLIPNSVHLYLANLEFMPMKLKSIITQNVDGLHYKAGSVNVVELHGNAFWVECLQCKHIISRFDFQTALEKCNPSMDIRSDKILPDGDVELSDEDVKNFKVPDCEKCGGILKPTVVFFGDNVPLNIVDKVEKLVEECESLLVLGTSLSTLSSYRIVQQAYDLNKFICLVNIGPTRGDKFADLKIDCKISDIFPQINKPRTFDSFYS